MTAPNENQNVPPSASQAKPTPRETASPRAPAPVAAPAPIPPVVWPNPLSHLQAPFQGVDYTLKGYHAEASVDADKIVSAAEELDREGFALDTITGVDWISESKMEVVYDFFHPTKPLRAVIRTRVPRENPQVPTLSRLYPGANWHEREAHDFFGICFQDHPNLTPFLLPEDATYHPLRKDFAA